jgi:hypothetical protein
MTTLLLALIVAQAAFLLWASVNLSNVFLQPNKGAQFLRFVVTFGLPVALSWYGRELDPHRHLCGWIDCLALAVGVALVRLWAVNRVTEEYVLERQLAEQAAADALEAARREYEEERIRAATLALEAKQAQAAAAAAQPARHLTTPVLRGGVRSARFPAKEKP